MDYDKLSDVRRDAFSCEHNTTAIGYVRTERGQVWYWNYCLRCGEKIDRLSKKEIPNPDDIQPLNDEIRRAFLERARLVYDSAYQSMVGERNRQWNAWYSQYLLTPLWRNKRALVLNRAGGMCEGCLTNMATEVHHLTYDRVGEEMLFDLVAICKECHNQIHRNKE